MRSVLPKSHDHNFRKVALLVMVIAWGWPSVVCAWGERGHQLINAAAVENLPEPLRSYFRARKEFLIEHAIDPDRQAHEDPSERPHHYTELDGYDLPPFRTFRRQFTQEGMAAPSNPEHGDSIWQIEHYTQRLTDALRRRRWDDADHAALFLAHYAADLTQPLHTTINFDGQLSGQTGIHARFETELVNAVAISWVLEPKPAVAEPDLRTRIFRELVASYTRKNVIFGADNIAVEGRSYQDPAYRAAFYRLAGLMAKHRVEAGASLVSSLWYTAWIRAGKPALPPGALSKPTSR